MAVQWLGLGAFTAEARGSILDRGTKILQATERGQKKKKKKKSQALEMQLQHYLPTLKKKSEFQGFLMSLL